MTSADTSWAAEFFFGPTTSPAKKNTRSIYFVSESKRCNKKIYIVPFSSFCHDATKVKQISSAFIVFYEDNYPRVAAGYVV